MIKVRYWSLISNCMNKKLYIFTYLHICTTCNQDTRDFKMVIALLLFLNLFMKILKAKYWASLKYWHKFRPWSLVAVRNFNYSVMFLSFSLRFILSTLRVNPWLRWSNCLMVHSGSTAKELLRLCWKSERWRGRCFKFD